MPAAVLAHPKDRALDPLPCICVLRDNDELRERRNQLSSGLPEARTAAERQSNQAVNTVDYWAYLLGCSAASRPATWLLVLVSFEAAAQIASFFKLKYNRPRPVQVWTAIAPSIPTPLSPSYPSGHALKSFLTAECMKLFAPNDMASQFQALAEQIALNRERGGVNFPSDTAASRRMTGYAIQHLRNNSEVAAAVIEGTERMVDSCAKARSSSEACLGFLS